MKATRINGQKTTALNHWFEEHPMVVATLVAAAIACTAAVGISSVKTDISGNAFGLQSSSVRR